MCAHYIGTVCCNIRKYTSEVYVLLSFWEKNTKIWNRKGTEEQRDEILNENIFSCIERQHETSQAGKKVAFSKRRNHNKYIGCLPIHESQADK